jgi:hypothetical protein
MVGTMGCWVCKYTLAALKPAGGEEWHAPFLKTATYWDWVQCGRAYVGFPWVRGPGCLRD